MLFTSFIPGKTFSKTKSTRKKIHLPVSSPINLNKYLAAKTKVYINIYIKVLDYDFDHLKIYAGNSRDDIEMGKFKVTGIEEEEEEQEIFNGKETIKGDGINELTEVFVKKL